MSFKGVRSKLPDAVFFAKMIEIRENEYEIF